MLQKSKTMPVAAAVGLSLFSLILTVFTVFMVFAARGSEEDTPASVAEKGTFRLLITAEDRTSGLCDVLMLASFDRDAGTVSVMQLPRDTYADFGKASYRKLNGASSYLGKDGLRSWLGDRLGISIDRYVHLSPDGFCRMVDALGGVELTLAEPMTYHDPDQGLDIDLPSGKQTLNGKQAEWFVRYRSGYAQGDLGRMDAQKIFLVALAEKAKAVRSPLTLVRLAAAVLAEAETDLSFSDLSGLCEELLAVEQENMLLLTAPGQACEGKDGGSYYVLSAPSMKEVLRTYFGGTEEFDSSHSFLHSERSSFRRAYESKADYRIHRADEVAEKGIDIPTAG